MIELTDCQSEKVSAPLKTSRGQLLTGFESKSKSLSRPEIGILIKGFHRKYGDPDAVGPGPSRRLKYGYFLPADIYESTVEQFVDQDTVWLDVGGGKSLFPDNEALATDLSSRCKWLVAVDPGRNILQNRFANERHQSCLENWATDHKFSLITARMVVEHVAAPEKFMQQISRLLVPGGLCVLLTVFRFAPVSLVSALVPFRFHNTIKRVFWSTEPEDTFATHYKLNTFRIQRHYANQAGLVEAGAMRLNDCSTSGAFGSFAHLELLIERGFRAVGLPYPEHCLLTAFMKPTTSPNQSIQTSVDARYLC